MRPVHTARSLARTTQRAYVVCSNGPFAPNNTSNSSISLMSLFHTATNTTRVEIQCIRVSNSAGFSTGTDKRAQFIGTYISAENAVSGGLTTAVNLDSSDPASSLTTTFGAVRVSPNPTTRIGPRIFTWSHSNLNGTGGYLATVFDRRTSPKRVVFNPLEALGFEIYYINPDSTINPTYRPCVTIYWTES